jgi:hypothetical protein
MFFDFVLYSTLIFGAGLLVDRLLLVFARCTRPDAYDPDGFDPYS